MRRTAVAEQMTSDSQQPLGSDDGVKAGRPMQAALQTIEDTPIYVLASSQQTQGKRTFTIETVRMVAAGVALVDSRYDIAQTDGTTRRMWAAWLLVKDGAAWKIAGIRNMLPAAPAR